MVPWPPGPLWKPPPMFGEIKEFKESKKNDKINVLFVGGAQTFGAPKILALETPLLNPSQIGDFQGYL